MDGENEGTEETITEEQVLSEGLLVEEASPNRVIVPKKGKLFAEDGTCKIAVIRPCVSRGRRLRGLPPIYTSQMLAENAGVFKGWLMYTDHLMESVVRALQERGRSIRELGGRVTESFFDPEFRQSDDDDYGYRPGAVVARALPQPLVRGMLEADPEILHVSINAYPKSVKPGTAPWNPQLKGMLVEGIRGKPPGSVDWVPRGGAGGKVLQETERAMLDAIDRTFAVSLSGSGYDPAHATPEDDVNWKDLTREQLAEKLRSENPDLAKALNLQEATPKPTLPDPTLQEGAPTGGVTMEQVQQMLQERDSQWETKLSEKDEELEERAQELLQEREEARGLARKAHALIKRSGLPSGYQADLLRRWDVLPSGPTPALASVEPVTEADGTQLSAEQVLTKLVERDLQHAQELIAEATGGRRPRVQGLGGGSANGDGQEQQASASSAFRDFLRESGDSFGDKPEDFENGLREMVREGVRD